MQFLQSGAGTPVHPRHEHAECTAGAVVRDPGREVQPQLLQGGGVQVQVETELLPPSPPHTAWRV